MCTNPSWQTALSGATCVLGSHATTPSPPPSLPSAPRIFPSVLPETPVDAFHSVTFAVNYSGTLYPSLKRHPIPPRADNVRLPGRTRVSSGCLFGSYTRVLPPPSFPNCRTVHEDPSRDQLTGSLNLLELWTKDQQTKSYSRTTSYPYVNPSP